MPHKGKYPMKKGSKKGKKKGKMTKKGKYKKGMKY